MKISKISANHLKEISKLKLKKYRDETSQFLIESEKVLLEALGSNWIVKEIFITSKNLDLLNRIEDLIKNKSINIYELSEKDFAKISNEKTPSGIAALLIKKPFSLDSFIKQNSDLILVFEEISDPGNLGTILRTADWFGKNFIVLSENSVDVTNPKVLKASMGSIFHLNIIEEIDIVDFIKKFKSAGYEIISTSSKGKDVRKFNFKPKSILIFGNEARGISSEVLNLSDQIVGIPSSGKAESLNLSISASIILYEIQRQTSIN